VRGARARERERERERQREREKREREREERGGRAVDELSMSTSSLQPRVHTEPHT
jgi:hypothetical protein